MRFVDYDVENYMYVDGGEFCHQDVHNLLFTSDESRIRRSFYFSFKIFFCFVLFCFVLFFFSSSLPFRRLSSTLGPISGDGFRQYKQMIFFLRILLKK